MEEKIKQVEDLENLSFADNGENVLSDAEFILSKTLSEQRAWRPGMII